MTAQQWREHLKHYPYRCVAEFKFLDMMIDDIEELEQYTLQLQKQVWKEKTIALMKEALDK
jgi:hypothetical protein